MLMGASQRELTGSCWPCLLTLNKRNPFAKGLRSEPEEARGHSSQGVERQAAGVPPFDLSVQRNSY